MTSDLYSFASSSARGPWPVSSMTVPSTHSAAPEPVVPEPIRTREIPRRTAPGSPPGSRPSWSTTASVPTPASPRSASLGTSRTRGLASDRIPGTRAAAGMRAASIAARTSCGDVSSGTTIPGRTTSSSRGSTGSVSCSLIWPPKIESTTLKKEEAKIISCACSLSAKRHPGTAGGALSCEYTPSQADVLAEPGRASGRRTGQRESSTRRARKHRPSVPARHEDVPGARGAGRPCQAATRTCRVHRGVPSVSAGDEDAPGRRPSGQPASRTCRVRGPCTPSTRISSMSLVADGPEISVCGRPGSSRPNAPGRSASTWSARTMTR